MLNSSMSIAAVLTLYRRPHTLEEQLRAVKNQTIKPSEIIIWKNGADDIKFPTISPELLEGVTIINSSKNFGVWARFSVALLCNTEYICILDDDTIPQKNWFKNCLETMKVTPGLLGSNGLCFLEGDQYECTIHGWHSANSITEEVDIVGHAWFFKKAWLAHLWTFQPDYDYMLVGGEDIAFSMTLQKAGIKTYVPPHPKDDLTVWGSLPETAQKYGTDSAAISLNLDNFMKIRTMLTYFIHEHGFETLANKRAKEAAEKKSV
jgi:GT2 family glycosyltransferase